MTSGLTISQAIQVHGLQKSYKKLQVLKGVDFDVARKHLFIIVMLASVFGFLISSVYALTTPYVLARTGSELTLGIITAIMSVGGLIGAIAIGAWADSNGVSTPS
jgi:hypothetical protein